MKTDWNKITTQEQRKVLQNILHLIDASPAELDIWNSQAQEDYKIDRLLNLIWRIQQHYPLPENWLKDEESEI